MGADKVFYQISPMACPRMTKRDVWKKRPVVVAYFAFRDEVKARRVSMPIPSKVIFWMPMPKAWSRKKKLEMDSAPHTVRPDLDNMLKGFTDAVFPKEDAAVWSVWPEKRWSTRPGIEVLPLCREVESGGHRVVRRDTPLTTTDGKDIPDG